MPRAASASIVAAALALTGCAAAPSEIPAAPRASASTPIVSLPTTAPAPALERGSPPRSVIIPAIGLDETLIDLAISADGDLEGPADYDDVGWFAQGGRPGGYGPTVIAGHVDSPTGPAVFVRLRELQAGDAVHVTDTAGGMFTYTVTEVADHPKADFPTARVFGATPVDELRLVTCGGTFDRAASSYLDNRVVYAVRAAP